MGGKEERKAAEGGRGRGCCRAAAGIRFAVGDVRAVRGVSAAEEKAFGTMLSPSSMILSEACWVLVRASPWEHGRGTRHALPLLIVLP